MNHLLTTLMAICLTACGSAGGGGAQLAQDPAFVGGTTGGTGGGATTQDVTLHQKSFTEAPVTGWSTKTYTSNGYCAEVNGKTFCWDDGVKTLQWTSGGFTFGPLTYSYFGVMSNPVNGSPLSCHGGCSGDYVFTPTIPDVGLNNVIGTAVSDLIANGAQSTITCNIIGNDLDCGTFTLAGAM